ncbi:glycoside hydrolase family 2 TIM barrel-domain containing protein [Saccharicrinis aurantiacus]|uniref:glycoside hydrolase family 2 TIM barrel-domain containing protein n=1 Tax=Saccharicrinis aurantiacus TaxID=1849719 RepID=UPI0024927A82|nr:glycoside hydrolase family 2 TIM barrel-domain containing protein [Saccharicrinis aurantiacus]
MKRILLNAIVVLMSITAMGQQQHNYTINSKWNFIKNNSIQDITAFSSCKNTAEIVNLPHTWNSTDVIDEELGYYRGAGWYSKELSIPTVYQDKELFLFFEGAATKADVYINNTLAKSHIGAYTRFSVPISSYINFDNTSNKSTFNITVKVDNSYHDDWPTLKGDFTLFGGIYRDVNIIIKDKVHFNFEEDASNGVFITTPTVTKEYGEVNIKANLRNNASVDSKVKLVTKIFGPDNILVQQKTKKVNLKANTSIHYNVALNPIEHPQLWSPTSPNLYRVVAEIVDSKTNQIIDEVVNPLGFRWYHFDAQEGFFINGEPLKLIGVNRHQDFKGIGNALPDHIHIEDVLRMKEMGCNFLRIAHYPQDAAILEMCDKLGILTSVETPVVDVVTESEEFAKNCLSAHREMIKQNFNHPSIIIWAYMNEVLLHPPYKLDDPKYKSYCNYLRGLAQQIDDLSRTEDAERYTMLVFHNSISKYKNAGLTEIPQIIGFNNYFGWYGGSYEKVEDRFLEYRKGVKQAILITEYGAGADPRLHTLEPTRFDFSQEYATEYHNHLLNLIKKTPYIAGSSLWNYADFSSEARVDAVQSINNKGIVSIDRKPKDVFFYYQAALLEAPFIALGTKTWSQRTYIEDAVGTGISTMPVQVFTNQKSVELFHNGVSLGIKETKNFIAEYSVPFVNGVNKLIANNQSDAYSQDVSSVRINVLPIELNSFPKAGISINTGDKRFFYDDLINQAWMFDKEYTKGSWGHVGGKPYVRPFKRVQQPYGAKQTIAGTLNDPIYQTQLVGIEQYRFDAPTGLYEITLHFAELEGKETIHLPYDLVDANDETMSLKNRTFSVSVNGNMVLNKIDLMANYGSFRAVKIKTQVSVKNEESIVIDFHKIVGEPILNGIEIFKKL